jgi:hypothetical protein
VIGALLAAESDIHVSYLDTVSSTAIAAALYWLAHAYATALGFRLTLEEPLSMRGLLRELANARGILRGASLPLLALVLAWTTGAPLHGGVTAALWTTIASLIAFELLAGIRSHAPPRELALEVGVGATMGIAILALKIVLR